MSNTGENDQGLRKIIDLTRFGSIFISIVMGLLFCGNLAVQLLTGYCKISNIPAYLKIYLFPKE
jgi:hypothetical protein